MSNVYLDTETTDFAPGQIAELSMIIEDDKQQIKAVNYFFSVDKIAPDAQAAHGYSKEVLEELSGGQKFADKASEIHGYLKDACLVAHNEAFDEKFISMEFWRCGISYQPAARVCTMQGFTNILKLPNRWKGKYKYPKLSEVADWLNIDIDKVKDLTIKLFGDDGRVGFHDSRFDTALLYVVTKVYGERRFGSTYWKDLYCR